ncbi:11288_t:CDS:2 [Ambispora gerdemannii]|uniref:11288_t:CDS:1 n=1 Tax=Ambispora gerdemannii TaxID=144530 RepID=A0A9N8WJX3_9GLOM|nr:11288_t:CDS:2 [Ambispora gerdemannii]
MGSNSENSLYPQRRNFRKRSYKQLHPYKLDKYIAEKQGVPVYVDNNPGLGMIDDREEENETETYRGDSSSDDNEPILSDNDKENRYGFNDEESDDSNGSDISSTLSSLPSPKFKTPPSKKIRRSSPRPSLRKILLKEIEYLEDNSDADDDLISLSLPPQRTYNFSKTSSSNIKQTSSQQPLPPPPKKTELEMYQKIPQFNESTFQNYFESFKTRVKNQSQHDNWDSCILRHVGTLSSRVQEFHSEDDPVDRALGNCCEVFCFLAGNIPRYIRPLSISESIEQFDLIMSSKKFGGASLLKRSYYLKYAKELVMLIKKRGASDMEFLKVCHLIWSRFKSIIGDYIVYKSAKEASSYHLMEKCLIKGLESMETILHGVDVVQDAQENRILFADLSRRLYNLINFIFNKDIRKERYQETHIELRLKSVAFFADLAWNINDWIRGEYSYRWNHNTDTRRQISLIFCANLIKKKDTGDSIFLSFKDEFIDVWFETILNDTEYLQETQRDYSEKLKRLIRNHYNNDSTSDHFPDHAIFEKWDWFGGWRQKVESLNCLFGAIKARCSIASKSWERKSFELDHQEDVENLKIIATRVRSELSHLVIIPV